MKKFKITFKDPTSNTEVKADFYIIEDGFVHFTKDAEYTGEKLASFPANLVKSIMT